MNEKKMIMIKKSIRSGEVFFSECILLSKLQRNFEISAKY